MTRLSVVIPCYNNERHVGEAIRSVLDQTLQAEEIIVVDDGSTDASVNVARAFGAAVRVLRQQNKGTAAARNAGVSANRGRYLAFLDADDIWPADSLARRVDIAERQNVDIAFGRVRQCRQAADSLSAGPEFPGRLAGAILIRRDLFDVVGLFDENLRTAETIDWIARAGEAGATQANCHAVVLYRRIHETNMMRTTVSPDRACLSVLRGALERRRAASIQ